MNHNLIYSRVFGNAQGSRVMVVVVQVGAVKIYVAAVEALRKKERGGSKQDETPPGLPEKKNGAFLSFTWLFLPLPPLNANNVHLQVVLNLTRVWSKLRVLELCLPDFTENSGM